MRTRLQVAFLVATFAALALAFTVSESFASSGAATSEGQPTAISSPAVDGIYPGQTYQAAEDRLRQLRRARVERNIRIEDVHVKCLSEERDDLVTGRARHRRGSCVDTIKFTGRDFDLIVSLVEDYPNNPNQMCVSSIEYDQRGFQNESDTFLSTMEQLYKNPKWLYGTPAPEHNADADLSSEITRVYFGDAPLCHHENNCFDNADRCLTAPVCVVVRADKAPADATVAAYHVEMVAKPYINQQNAFHNADLANATKLRFLSTLSSLPSVSLRFDDRKPRCETRAYLVPPLVKSAADELAELPPKETPKITPKETPQGGLDYFKVSVGGQRTDRTFCSDYVCLREFDLASGGVEILGYYLASGTWKPIWALQGPDDLGLEGLRALIEYRTPNDGWSESPETPRPPSTR
jgi:hypothetical protein